MGNKAVSGKKSTLFRSLIRRTSRSNSSTTNSLLIELNSKYSSKIDLSLWNYRVATTYLNLGNYQESIHYFQEAIAIIIQKEGVYSENLISLYANLSQVYKSLGLLNDQIFYLKKSQEIMKFHSEYDLEQHADCIECIAQAEKSKREFKNEEYHLVEALNLRIKKFGENSSKLNKTLIRLSKNALNQNRYKESIDFANKIIKNRSDSKKFLHVECAKAYQTIYTILKKQNKIEKAIENLESAIFIYEADRSKYSNHLLLSYKLLSKEYCDLEEFSKMKDCEKKIYMLLFKNFSDNSEEIVNCLKRIAFSHKKLCETQFYMRLYEENLEKSNSREIDFEANKYFYTEMMRILSDSDIDETKEIEDIDFGEKIDSSILSK